MCFMCTICNQVLVSVPNIVLKVAIAIHSMWLKIGAWLTHTDLVNRLCNSRMLFLISGVGNLVLYHLLADDKQLYGSGKIFDINSIRQQLGRCVPSLTIEIGAHLVHYSWIRFNGAAVDRQSWYLQVIVCWLASTPSLTCRWSSTSCQVVSGCFFQFDWLLVLSRLDYETLYSQAIQSWPPDRCSVYRTYYVWKSSETCNSRCFSHVFCFSFEINVLFVC